MADNANTSTGSQGDSVRQPRTLILCFDGTADQYDGSNTNVVKLYSLLNKDESQQLCYYQPGVGTYFNPGVVSPMFQWAAKILDEAVAWYLDAHVRGGYWFLMQNYRPGDKISIFGFSRGAYTARAVAGMIHKIGILPKDNPEQLPFAYRLYTKTDAASLVLAEGFKRTFCRPAEIEFVGVWDTVASVGLLVSRTLPFTTANTTIKTFRHALSLDEHRAKFRPNLYHYPAPNAEGAEGDPEHATPVIGTPSVSLESFQRQLKKAARKEECRFSNLFRRKPSKEGEILSNMDSILEENPAAYYSNAVAAATGTALYGGLLREELVDETDVLEVWFAGCHADVGGSATPDSTKLCLSDITLRWMIHQVISAQCGVVFDSDSLRAANIPESIFECATSPSILQFVEKKNAMDTSSNSNGDSSSGSGAPLTPAAQERVDAVQPLHDALKTQPLWWLAEIIPLGYAYQDAEGVWHNSWSINLGRGRIIPTKQPKFHVTVKERMADKSLEYMPKAQWTHGTEVYVS